MESPPTSPTVELLLANLQKSLEVGMTKIQGDVALVLQRLDQSDARHAELVKRVEDLEKSQREAATTVVTREDQAQRWTRVAGVIGLVLTGLSITVAAVLGIIGLLRQ